MIYLASPYSHINKALQEERYQEAMRAVAYLLSIGIHIYSPILHCHPLANRYTLPTDAGYWQSYNEDFISSSSSLLVLCIDGWRESRGVTMEKEYANRHHVPVEYLYTLSGDLQWRISEDPPE